MHKINDVPNTFGGFRYLVSGLGKVHRVQEGLNIKVQLDDKLALKPIRA